MWNTQHDPTMKGTTRRIEDVEGDGILCLDWNLETSSMAKHCTLDTTLGYHTTPPKHPAINNLHIQLSKSNMSNDHDKQEQQTMTTTLTRNLEQDSNGNNNTMVKSMRTHKHVRCQVKTSWMAVPWGFTLHTTHLTRHDTPQHNDNGMVTTTTKQTNSIDEATQLITQKRDNKSNYSQHVRHNNES